MSLTAEQQAIRSTGIGSSEIGVLAGLSKWATPIAIYEAKLGLRPDIAMTYHMERGTFVEEALLKWYASREKCKIDMLPGTLRHDAIARVVATPDGLRFGDDGKRAKVLEAKSPSSHTWHEWGDPGTDNIPPAYIAQVQWEMACAGVDQADVLVLINDDLKIYPVAFDAELFADLAEIANAFWRNHIEARRPPDPDGSNSYEESIKRRFPTAGKERLQASADVAAIAEELRLAKLAFKEAETNKKRIEQAIKEVIGGNYGLVGDFGSITWSECKGKLGFDLKAFKLKHPELAAEFSKRGSPYRTLRANFVGVEDDEQEEAA